MTKVLVTGHLCVDIAPLWAVPPHLEPGALIEIGAPRVSVGGPVGNTGLNLADSGVDVVVDAVVGDDQLGKVAVDLLRERSVDTSRITVDSRFATSYSVIVESPGVDRTIWHHPGANNAFDGTHVDLAGIDLLHLGYPPLLPALLTENGDPLWRLLERAKAAGLTTSLDLAVVDPASPVASVDWKALLRRVLPLVDLISPSWDDLVSMRVADPSGDRHATAAMLRELGVAVVAMSAGPQGLLLISGDEQRLRDGGRALAPFAAGWTALDLTRRPAPITEVLTTNGAGDASTAGLLFALARGDSGAEAADWAARFAGVALGGRRTTPEALGA